MTSNIKPICNPDFKINRNSDFKTISNITDFKTNNNPDFKTNCNHGLQFQTAPGFLPSSSTVSRRSVELELFCEL